MPGGNSAVRVRTSGGAKRAGILMRPLQQGGSPDNFGGGGGRPGAGYAGSCSPEPGEAAWTRSDVAGERLGWDDFLTMHGRVLSFYSRNPGKPEGRNVTGAARREPESKRRTPRSAPLTFGLTPR